eukprot:gene17020-22526_t
MGARCSDCFNI